MRAENSQLVMCVRNTGYKASLELRKIYTALPDHCAERLGQVRVIDESGEDCLFPADRFVPADVLDHENRSVIDAA